MAEGRAKENWQHTSALMALIANAHRDPKKVKPFEPADFNPYAQKSPDTIVITKENIGLLRSVFLGS